MLGSAPPALQWYGPRTLVAPRRFSGTAPRPRPLRVRTTTPAQPPPLSPGRGGSRTAVPARPALVVRPSAALRGVRTRPPRGGGPLGDTRWRTHLSPAAAQPLRRGSTPAHRHAALGPAPVFPGCSGSGGGGGSGGNGSSSGGNAFSEPDPTARAARPPRPLPPAPAYRPLPPSGRKYRLLLPQTGTDVKAKVGLGER